MSENESTAIAIQELPERPGLITIPPKRLLKQLKKDYLARRAFAKSLLVQGIDQDYATLPGTQKPTLLQPGADKIISVAKLRQKPKILDSSIFNHKDGFYFVVAQVDLLNSDGEIVGTGLGACSSKEGKYAYRWVKPEDFKFDPMLKDYDLKDLKSKKNKYGNIVYRVPNFDIDDGIETYVQMAIVRAKRKAAQTTFALSGDFTVNLAEEAEYGIDEAPVKSKKATTKVVDKEEPPAPGDSSEPTLKEILYIKCDENEVPEGVRDTAIELLLRDYDADTIEDIPPDKKVKAINHFMKVSLKYAQKDA